VSDRHWRGKSSAQQESTESRIMELLKLERLDQLEHVYLKLVIRELAEALDRKSSNLPGSMFD
jgi:hypothetical protein